MLRRAFLSILVGVALLVPSIATASPAPVSYTHLTLPTTPYV